MALLLGSNSPRRRDLLAGVDITYTIVRIDADESYPAELQAGDIPLFISRQKAQAYGPVAAEDILITADTIVWCEGRMLGKPKDEDDARRMLATLSGRTHQVYTGVTIVQGATGLERQFVVRTDVTFRPIAEEEIDYYVRTYRPLDKAGSYGIQEWIGYVACTGLQGSYYNVMGFPIQRVYEELRRMGVETNLGEK